MRVKINDTWYDAKDTAICLELTMADRNNIYDMALDATKYAEFPDDDPRSNDEKLSWMGN